MEGLAVVLLIYKSPFQLSASFEEGSGHQDKVPIWEDANADIDKAKTSRTHDRPEHMDKADWPIPAADVE